MTRPTPSRGQRTSVIDAIEQSDSLSDMLSTHKKSNFYLITIKPLLSADLFSQLKAGPIDESGWCLLAPHNAAAAKLRQLLPDIVT
ncbi:MAG: hypothetical protein ACKO69_06945, partial [Limnohabitans sp.]